MGIGTQKFENFLLDSHKCYTDETCRNYAYPWDLQFSKKLGRNL